MVPVPVTNGPGGREDGKARSVYRAKSSHPVHRCALPDPFTDGRGTSHREDRLEERARKQRVPFPGTEQ